MPPGAKRKSKKEKKEEADDVVEEKKEIEPIVLQLSISPQRLNELMDIVEEIPSVLEYNPQIVDPIPYFPHNNFISENDVLVSDVPQPASHAAHTHSEIETCNRSSDQSVQDVKSRAATCFWCCHGIEHMEYGMPIRYDVYHKSFTTYGSFCSLECAAAYNYSIHMGSDRVWEIHSWIQMLASRYGYQGNVRPAPSRYALQMFNGPLTIEEFRNAHKSLARTCIMNIPPFIHVSSQLEVLNTSFLDTNNSSDNNDKTKMKKKVTEKKIIETKLPSTFISTTECI